jgi:hypothetical protein
MHSLSPDSLDAGGRPHTANSGDVAKFLAVVALRKGVFGFIGLYLDGNVAEAGQFKQVLGFCCPR